MLIKRDVVNGECFRGNEKIQKKLFLARVESVIYSVIKKRLKWKDGGEVGKETPKKEMDNKRIFMTSYMTLSIIYLG